MKKFNIESIKQLMLDHGAVIADALVKFHQDAVMDGYPEQDILTALHSLLIGEIVVVGADAGISKKDIHASVDHFYDLPKQETNLQIATTPAPTGSLRN